MLYIEWLSYLRRKLICEILLPNYFYHILGIFIFKLLGVFSFSFFLQKYPVCFRCYNCFLHVYLLCCPRERCWSAVFWVLFLWKSSSSWCHSPKPYGGGERWVPITFFGSLACPLSSSVKGPNTCRYPFLIKVVLNDKLDYVLSIC